MKQLFLPPFAAATLLLASVPTADAGNVTVSTGALPLTAGTTSGGGSYATGTSVTIQADAMNDCYQFVEWTVSGVKVSSENPYTFTAKTAEKVVAVFAQVKYTILTSSSPANGGTTLGGGKKGCGALATVTAHAKRGFAFEGWTLDGSPVSSSAVYKFTVSENAGLVANFRDIAPPVVKILSPFKNQPVTTAAFPIQWIATDNVAVAAVYYNLNGAGWVEASNLNYHATWYAWVSLIPNASNTVLAYAMDTSGNTNPALSTSFLCTAAGYAPLSIAGHQAALSNLADHCTSAVVSFDLASYVRLTACTTNAGEVGTYTYTPTGSNTAELVAQRFAPPDPAGGGIGGLTLELTFTDAYNATFTDSSGGSGYFNFVLAEDTVPASLDGATIAGASFIVSNYVSTNIFGSSSYTFGDNLGDASAGTYTFTKFTDVGALIAQTVAGPPGGETNYIVLSFVQGATPLNGFYDFASVSGASETFDTGTFVLTPGTDGAAFVGPATLSGTRVVVSPTGGPPFTRFFGNGTFASIAPLSSNEPTDVGIMLANPRVTANTGTEQYFGLAPAYVAGQDNETVDLTFNTATSAQFVVEGDAQEHGTGALARQAQTVPAALSGHTIKTTPSGGGSVSVTTFTYNEFTSEEGFSGTGTYTYAAYAPTVALMTGNITGGAAAGQTVYLFLEFAAPGGGTYVFAQPDATNAGQWDFTRGLFTFK